MRQKYTHTQLICSEAKKNFILIYTNNQKKKSLNLTQKINVYMKLCETENLYVKRDVQGYLWMCGWSMYWKIEMDKFLWENE